MAKSMTRTQYLILTAMFTALTAVGAFIKIPVGPTPITLQLLFIALAGVLLGPWYGTLSQVLYVAIGLVGVPIFAAGGGFGYVFHPSFGYLIGFMFVPGIIHLLLRGDKRPSVMKLTCATMIAILCVYLIGIPYMYFILTHVMGASTSASAVIMTGFVVFLPGDIAKSIITGLLGNRLMPILRK